MLRLLFHNTTFKRHLRKIVQSRTHITRNLCLEYKGWGSSLKSDVLKQHDNNIRVTKPLISICPANLTRRVSRNIFQNVHLHLSNPLKDNVRLFHQTPVITNNQPKGIGVWYFTINSEVVSESRLNDCYIVKLKVVPCVPKNKCKSKELHYMVSDQIDRIVNRLKDSSNVNLIPKHETESVTDKYLTYVSKTCVLDASVPKNDVPQDLIEIKSDIDINKQFVNIFNRVDPNLFQPSSNINIIPKFEPDDPKIKDVQKTVRAINVDRFSDVSSINVSDKVIEDLDCPVPMQQHNDFHSNTCRNLERSGKYVDSSNQLDNTSENFKQEAKALYDINRAGNHSVHSDQIKHTPGNSFAIEAATAPGIINTQDSSELLPSNFDKYLYSCDSVPSLISAGESLINSTDYKPPSSSNMKFENSSLTYENDKVVGNHPYYATDWPDGFLHRNTYLVEMINDGIKFNSFKGGARPVFKTPNLTKELDETSMQGDLSRTPYNEHRYASAPTEKFVKSYGYPSVRSEKKDKYAQKPAQKGITELKEDYNNGGIVTSRGFQAQKLWEPFEGLVSRRNTAAASAKLKRSENNDLFNLKVVETPKRIDKFSNEKSKAIKNNQSVTISSVLKSQERLAHTIDIVKDIKRNQSVTISSVLKSQERLTHTIDIVKDIKTRLSTTERATYLKLLKYLNDFPELDTNWTPEDEAKSTNSGSERCNHVNKKSDPEIEKYIISFFRDSGRMGGTNQQHPQENSNSAIDKYVKLLTANKTALNNSVGERTRNTNFCTSTSSKLTKIASSHENPANVGPINEDLLYEQRIMSTDRGETQCFQNLLSSVEDKKDSLSISDKNTEILSQSYIGSEKMYQETKLEKLSQTSCLPNKEKPETIRIPADKDDLLPITPGYKSVLDSLTSVDKSGVIIRKDLYITEKIVKKIKEEEKESSLDKFQPSGIYKIKTNTSETKAFTSKEVLLENGNFQSKQIEKNAHMLKYSKENLENELNLKLSLSGVLYKSNSIGVKNDLNIGDQSPIRVGECDKISQDEALTCGYSKMGVVSLKSTTCNKCVADKEFLEMKINNKGKNIQSRSETIENDLSDRFKETEGKSVKNVVTASEYLINPKSEETSEDVEWLRNWTPTQTCLENKHQSLSPKGKPEIVRIKINRDDLPPITPNYKSVLDAITSIDKSGVIIQKDFYITEKIIKKIREEEEKRPEKVQSSTENFKMKALETENLNEVGENISFRKNIEMKETENVFGPKNTDSEDVGISPSRITNPKVVNPKTCSKICLQDFHMEIGISEIKDVTLKEENESHIPKMSSPTSLEPTLLDLKQANDWPSLLHACKANKLLPLTVCKTKSNESPPSSSAETHTSNRIESFTKTNDRLAFHSRNRSHPQETNKKTWGVVEKKGKIVCSPSCGITNKVTNGNIHAKALENGGKNENTLYRQDSTASTEPTEISFVKQISKNQLPITGNDTAPRLRCARNFQKKIGDCKDFSRKPADSTHEMKMSTSSCASSCEQLNNAKVEIFDGVINDLWKSKKDNLVSAVVVNKLDVLRKKKHSHVEDTDNSYVESLGGSSHVTDIMKLTTNQQKQFFHNSKKPDAFDFSISNTNNNVGRKTIIISTKSGENTNIEIIDLQTYIDERLPIPFLTETVFQVISKTETLKSHQNLVEITKSDATINRNVIPTTLGDKPLKKKYLIPTEEVINFPDQAKLDSLKTFFQDVYSNTKETVIARNIPIRSDAEIKNVEPTSQHIKNKSHIEGEKSNKSQQNNSTYSSPLSSETKTDKKKSTHNNVKNIEVVEGNEEIFKYKDIKTQVNSNLPYIKKEPEIKNKSILDPNKVEKKSNKDNKPIFDNKSQKQDEPPQKRTNQEPKYVDLTEFKPKDTKVKIDLIDAQTKTLPKKNKLKLSQREKAIIKEVIGKRTKPKTKIPDKTDDRKRSLEPPKTGKQNPDNTEGVSARKVDTQTPLKKRKEPKDELLSQKSEQLKACFGRETRGCSLGMNELPATEMTKNIEEAADKMKSNTSTETAPVKISQTDSLYIKDEIRAFREGIKARRRSLKNFKQSGFEIDLDKLNKEIKPIFKPENSAKCKVPISEVSQFPLLNEEKQSEYVKSEVGIVSVNPTNSQELHDTLATYPCVSRILNSTMNKGSRAALRRWRVNMITQLGESGFQDYYKAELETGCEFHNSIRSLLHGGGLKKTIRPTTLLSLKSVDWILKLISDVGALDSQVIHPQLGYRGVLDCVAKYRNNPVLIEWKRCDKPKPSLQSTYEAPLQLSAYLGAMNYDSNYKFQVNGGLIVASYSDGSPADTFQLSMDQCHEYWKKWLVRYEEYLKVQFAS